MRRIAGRGIGLSLTITLAAGCGGTAMQNGTLPFQGASGITTPARSAALLYVAHKASYTSDGTTISILTFPQNKPVATIRVGYLSGMCSDSSGNVWIVVYQEHPAGYYLVKYPHGKTKPIEQIRIPERGFGNGCAVDPSTGDLAVTIAAGGSSGGGSVEIWAGGRAGTPATYSVPFNPINDAYDEHGNLFIDGNPGGSDPWLLFGELAKGSGAVASVTLDRKTSLPGAVQWDGAYIAVETGGYQPYMRGNPRIYRIEMSGSGARVVQTVIAKDPPLRGTTPFVVSGNSVVATSQRRQGEVDVWPYPAGGSATQIIGRFGYVRGLTISP